MFQFGHCWEQSHCPVNTTLEKILVVVGDMISFIS